VKVGPVQPALNTDMDAYTNVESAALSISIRKKVRFRWSYTYIEQIGTSIPIPIPAGEPAGSATGSDSSDSHEFASAGSHFVPRRFLEAVSLRKPP